MKKIKWKKAGWLLCFLLSVSFASAQQGQGSGQGQGQNANGPGPDGQYFFSVHPGSNFLKIKQEGQLFYQNQINQYGEQSVATEGSPYLGFQQFVNEWEPKLAPYQYSFDLYFQSQKKLPAASKVVKFNKNCNWDELGPLVSSVGGPDSWGTRIEGIGHTEFIRFDPTNHDRMLAGSIEGGLFFSSNAGDFWSCVSDDWGVPGCAWAEFSKDYPGTIIACTTGGQNKTTGKATAMGPDGALMMSNDYGLTWSELLSEPVISRWDKLNKVMYPNDGSLGVYLAKNDGLFYYTNIAVPNNPAMLQLVDDFVIPGQFINTNCLDLEIIDHPALFPNGPFMAVTVGGIKPGATASDPDVYHLRAFISEDGGDNFTEVFTTLDMFRGNFEFSPTTADDPAHLDEAVIHYYTELDNGEKRVYTYNLYDDDGHGTLLHINTESNNFGSCFAFAVNPFDADKIVFSSWIHLYGTIDNFATSGSAMMKGGLHDDMEHFVWHPDPLKANELWVANHGGIERSIDNGVTWEDKSKNLGVANIQTFDDVSGNPNRMLLSIFHNGTVRLDNSYYQPPINHEWKLFHGWDGQGATIIENGDLNFYFAGGQKANTDGYQTSYGPHSVNGPLNFGAGFNAWFEPSTMRRSVFTPQRSGSGKVDVNRSDLVAGMAPSGYLISEFDVIPGFTNKYQARGIFASKLNPNRLFANGFQEVPIGTGGNTRQDHFLLYTPFAEEDATTVKSSWQEIYMPYDPISDINKVSFRDVVASHYIPNRYYIVTGGTADGAGTDNHSGLVWQLDFLAGGGYNLIDITGNLPRCNVGGGPDNAMEIEKGSHEALYLTLHCGVYYLHGSQLDQGDYNWGRTGGGLPNIKKNGIKINYEINQIRVGTDGRGMWEGCLVCPYQPYSTQSGVIPDRFTEVQDYITSTAIINPNRNVKYRAGSEILLEPGFIAKTTSEFSAFIHSCQPNGKNSFRSSTIDPWAGGITESPVEAEDAPLLSVYPNPTANQIMITLADAEDEVGQVELLDLQGKMIKTWTTTFDQEQTSISDLSPGIYLIRVTVNDHTETFKINKL